MESVLAKLESFLKNHKMVDIIFKETYNVRKGQSQAEKRAAAMLA